MMLLVERAIAISGDYRFLPGRVVNDIKNIIPFVPQRLAFLSPHFLFYNTQDVRALGTGSEHIIEIKNFVVAIFQVNL